MKQTKKLFPLRFTKSYFLFITLVLIISFTVLSIIVSRNCFQSVNEAYGKELHAVTLQLEEKLPNSFDKVLEQQNAQSIPVYEQVKVINSVLQPIVEQLALSHPDIDMGYYCLELDHVVASAPDFKPSHLSPVPPVPQLEYQDFSNGWLNAPTLQQIYPIYRNDKLIGCTWANRNMEDIYRHILSGAAQIILAGMIILALVITSSWYVFKRLSDDLKQFALGIINDKANTSIDFLPDLNPLVKLIKDQKERLAKNNQQLQHLAFIVESSDDAIIGATEGIITSWNAGAERIYGYTAEEAIGQSLLILAPDEEQDSFLETIEKIKKGENLGHFETTRIRKDGTLFNASLTISPVKDAQGRVVGTSGIVRDITERKKADEKLRLSEERFSKVFDCSPNLIFIKSLRDGRLIDVNKSWCQHTGYKKEEVIGKSVKELNLFNEKTIKKVPTSNLKISYRTKAGEQRTGLISTEVIDINGEDCLLGMLLDTTEIDLVDKEMKRLDRLNLVGQMAAGIGHEIRNPMTTVRGFLQLFQNKEKNPEHKKYFALMIEELDRANSIITEFLSLAKSKPLKLEKQNLKTLIEKVMPLIEADAIKSNNKASFNLEDVPDLLLNEREIRQIIFNLVRNGFDAMENSGMLSISTYTEGNTVVLAVKDEGKGIEPEVMDQIGTPFFTTKAEGTGLGLAVCYSIAAKHKADIHIDSNNNGTTFFVKFELPNK